MARRWKSVVVKRPRRLHGKQPWSKRSPAPALPLSTAIAPGTRRWKSLVVKRPRRLHGKQPWFKRSPAPALPLSTAIAPGTLDWKNLMPKDSVVTDIVDIAVLKNTILCVSASLDETILKIVIRFTKLCLDIAVRYPGAPGAKAVVTTPTMTLARKYFDAARRFMPTMRTRLIIATEWWEVAEADELLIITPCIFLDAPRAGHVSPFEFCSLVFVECKHCVGSRPHSHPFSKIPSVFSTAQPRILGLATAQLTPSQVTALKNK